MKLARPLFALPDTAFHRYTISIDSGGFATFYRDGVPITVSSGTVLVGSKPISVGGQSAGGVARVDNVEVRGNP